MINSFSSKTKIFSKNSNKNSIRHKDRRLDNNNNDNKILQNDKEKKKNNNNFIYYSNNINNNKKGINLSEINPKLKSRDSCQSPKKEESNTKESGRKIFNAKNHNYHNIIEPFDSLEKNNKNYIKYSHNTFDIKNNLKEIKLLDNKICTPRIQDKNKCFVYQRNNTDLSKNLNDFKNRENYGYHEIKDVKKNNYVQSKNICHNSDRKNNIQKFSSYLSINANSNNSFRNSFKMNKISDNNNSSINYRNEIKKKIFIKIIHNSNGSNNNNNILNNNEYFNSNRKSNYININNHQNKSYISEKFKVNNFPSNSNFKSQKSSYNDRNNNVGLLKKRIYNTCIPEGNKKADNISCSRANYVKRNIRNINSINSNKNIIVNNKFLSGDLRDAINKTKIEQDLHKINNIIKKSFNKKSQIINMAKNCSPIKKDKFIKINHHNKHNSLKNYNEFKTEEKQAKKIEPKEIFKKIDNKNFSKFSSFSRLNRYNNNNKINENLYKKDSKDKNKKSVIIISQNSRNERNDNYKEKQEKQKSEIFTKNPNINNIRTSINRRNEQKTELNNDNKIKIKKFKIGINKFSGFFNSEDLKKDNIKKLCRSSEKSSTKKRKNNSSVGDIRYRGYRTKSKSKKHSNKIKYLDKLKIFKYAEANFNYDSSTNCSKENNADIKYKKFIIRRNKTKSKKKKNINSLNLNYKSFEEDFKLKENNVEERCINLKPQISCRITLTKKNNVNIMGLLRYFKVNYLSSENLRNKYDVDSEDTSEFYNAKF